MSRTITMGRDLKKCRKDRKKLQEENLALKQQIENMSSFSRDRISTLRSEGNGKLKPDRYYTADGVLDDLGIDAWEKLGDARRAAKEGKTQGGRRKTRRKRGGMAVPDFYKKRVDRQEEAKQWKLNREMLAAKMKHDDKKQAKIKKQLQKSFKRQEYYHTPGDAKNKDAIANFQIRRAMPEIEKAEREGRLVPRKTRKRSSSAGRKRRKKTKKKRHIITRKNKRKRRRRTKKRKRGGMPKYSGKPINNRVAELRNKSVLRKPSKALKLKKKVRFARSPLVRSGLNTMSNRASPSATLESQLANLNLGSQTQSPQQTQQQPSESK